MPQNPAIVLPAPSGMDTTSALHALPPTRARFLQNLLTDRAGVARAACRRVDLSETFPNAIDGLAYYYSEDGTADALLIISEGVLYKLSVDATVWPPTFGTKEYVGTGFATGQRVQWAAFGTETIFVQEGGMQPKRFNGTNLYQLGITAPTSAPAAFNGTPSGGATTQKSGTTAYAYTYFDERFRESDMSPSTSLTFTTGNDAYINIGGYGLDPQVQGAYVYARPSGQANFYRIATLTKPITTYEDNQSDTSIIASGVQGPEAGIFALPNPASCIAIHKNRVWLNDTTDANVLQVNNVDSATQWAIVDITTRSIEGLRLEILTGASDFITGLVSFGSLLAIWKRSAFFLMWGDSNSDWTVRQVHTQGTDAIYSVARCDNLLNFAYANGVYTTNYEGVFKYEKASKEFESRIEALTLNPTPLTTNAWDTWFASTGWYYWNHYFLNVGETTYAFAFDTGGWSTFDFGGPLTAQVVVQPRNGPPMAFVGDAAGVVGYLDLFTEAPEVEGIILETGAFDAAEINRVRRRGKQLTVFGEGANVTGTVEFIADGTVVQSTPVYGPWPLQRGVLLSQGCNRDVFGRELQARLTLQGEGVTIDDVRLEFTLIDG